MILDLSDKNSASLRSMTCKWLQPAFRVMAIAMHLSPFNERRFAEKENIRRGFLSDRLVYLCAIFRTEIVDSTSGSPAPLSANCKREVSVVGFYPGIVTIAVYNRRLSVYLWSSSAVDHLCRASDEPPRPLHWLHKTSSDASGMSLICKLRTRLVWRHRQPLLSTPAKHMTFTC